MVFQRLKNNWNRFSKTKKYLIVFVISIILLYFFSFYHTQEIKIQISDNFWNFYVTSNYYSERCSSSGNNVYRHVNDSEMPEKFREYNITIYCTEAKQNIDEVQQRSYWDLDRVHFSVKYPVSIVQRFNNIINNYDEEFFLIKGDRDNWINGLYGNFKIEFLGFSPTYTMKDSKGYSNTDGYYKPDFLVMKLTWFEPPDVYEFLSSQFGTVFGLFKDLIGL